jgi:hypothetical protein
MGTSVRCAICKTFIHYLEQTPDKLFLGSNRGVRNVVGKKVAGHWVHENHTAEQCEPFKIIPGTKVVAERGKVGNFVLLLVDKVRPNGSFLIGEDLYNIFGVRLRGMGPSRILRVAKLEDIERHEEKQRAEYDERQRREQREREHVKLKTRIEERIKELVGEPLKKSNFYASRHDEETWEVVFYVKPKDLGIS